VEPAPRGPAAQALRCQRFQRAAGVVYYGALVLKIKTPSPPLRLGRLYSRRGRRQGRKGLRFARSTVACDVATQVANDVAGEGAGVQGILVRRRGRFGGATFLWRNVACASLRDRATGARHLDCYCTMVTSKPAA
jgi:hypothetical protein